MNFRDIFIGSTIVGIFSCFASAIVLPLLLKGNDNLKAFPILQIIPTAIGLITFIVFFSRYSLVDITPNTWEFSEKWDEHPDYGNDNTDLDQ